jgi:hypothetical protein
MKQQLCRTSQASKRGGASSRPHLPLKTRFVKPQLVNDTRHDTPVSPLRRVSELPHTIYCWFQSIPKWFLPDSCRCQLLGSMDFVLFLRQAAHLQPMVRKRPQDVCRFRSSSQPRLWPTRRDRAGRQNFAPFELICVATMQPHSRETTE